MAIGVYRQPWEIKITLRDGTVKQIEQLAENPRTLMLTLCRKYPDLMGRAFNLEISEKFQDFADAGGGK